MDITKKCKNCGEPVWEALPGDWVHVHCYEGRWRVGHADNLAPFRECQVDPDHQHAAPEEA